MFQPVLTTYGQSLISSRILIDGVALLFDYISNVQSILDFSTYTVNLDIDSVGNFNGTTANIRIQDLSSSEYLTKTILFYVKEDGNKKVVAGYSQEQPIISKTETKLSLFLSFDFSIFTHGFLLSSIQASPSTASHNLDGIVHIENPNVSVDDTYSVYTKRQVDSLFDNNISLIGPYIYCETESNTVKKEVVIPNFRFEAGSRVLIKFKYANTASNPTLCIHNVAGDTGTTYAIMRYGSNAVGSNYLSWLSNQVIELVFDGTYWYWQGFQYYVYSAYCLNNNYNIDGVGFNGTGNRIHFGNCSTAANTQIKDVVITGFNTASVLTGSRVSVKFTNSNTVQNPQLRVSSSGTNGTAKPIVYRGTSSVSNGSDYYRWQAGSIIEFVYDGTNWVWVGFQEYVKYSDFSNNTYYLCGSDGDGLYGDWYILEDESEEPVFIAENSVIPLISEVCDLGKPNNRWNNVYADTFNGDLSGNASTATTAISATTSTTAQGLSKTVSNTDYTLSLNANNCWQPNTAIETTSQVGPYVYCTTASNAVKKEVTIPNFQFRAGSRLLIKFKYANYADNPTLCIHNVAGDTGTTYAIMRYGTNAVGSGNDSLSWLVNQVLEFVFDGTYWYWQGYPYYSDTSKTSKYATYLGKDDSNIWLQHYISSSSYGDLITKGGIGIFDESDDYVGRLWFNDTFNVCSVDKDLFLGCYIRDNNDYKIIVNRDITPNTDNITSLGRESKKWKSIWTNNIYFGNTASSTPRMCVYNTELDVYGNLLPGSKNTYSLGSSTYAWKEIYTNDINIVFLEITIYGTGGGSSTYYLEKGTIISSGVYNITSLQYANIHFYTDPTTGRSAYDSGYDYNNTTYKAPTGSYKLLARIRYWLDGGTRTFVVPAIQVVS